MAEPTNAERVNRYFRSIGIAPRARRAPRPELEDDDIDVEIGAARVEPEEGLDVQFGDAQVEDDDIDLLAEVAEAVDDMGLGGLVALRQVEIEHGDPDVFAGVALGARVLDRLPDRGEALLDILMQ